MRIRWEHSHLPSSPSWDDKPVALIGGGASLKGVDLSPLQCAHTIAVKGTLFDLPWAEIGFGLDAIDLRRWWKKLDTAKMPVYWAVGDRWADPVKTFFPRPLKLLKRRSTTDLSKDAGLVASGGSSGFGALNAATLRGSRLIVLFGYDYCALGKDWHANGSHYDPRHFYNPKNWNEWAACFDDAIEQFKSSGIEVVNASPNSIIKAFPKVSIEEGLRLCLN